MITINSRKFDNSIHRSWKCRLIEETSDYWLFIGEFDREVSHKQLGVIRLGTVSCEYYFKNKWYNVFLFYEPDGDFKFYYCNINTPPKLEKNELDYIDLDLDILVQKDFSFKILDEDEFISNSKLFGYSDEIIQQANKSLVELSELIKTNQFPFTEKPELFHLSNV